MFESAMYHFLLDVPQATLIWLALMILAMLAIAGLVTRPSWNLSISGLRRRDAALRRQRLTAQAQEANRYAEEVAVAAERAEARARRCRSDWLTAQDEAEAAWQAYEKLDAQSARMTAAAALPVPRTPRTPAEYAARERYLHRAATAAYWRGEISVLQLGDVLAHRRGWDPRRHPVEQEVMLHRAARAGLRARQQRAAEWERTVWQNAEVAARAAQSLRAEATVAAEQVRQLEQQLAGVAPRSARVPRPASATPRQSEAPTQLLPVRVA
ncbi:hypothetical protein ACWDV4_19945 [Micromonospora sp. NPDC003197]